MLFLFLLVTDKTLIFCLVSRVSLSDLGVNITWVADCHDSIWNGIFRAFNLRMSVISSELRVFNSDSECEWYLLYVMIRIGPFCNLNSVLALYPQQSTVYWRWGKTRLLFRMRSIWVGRNRFSSLTILNDLEILFAIFEYVHFVSWFLPVLFVAPLMWWQEYIGLYRADYHTNY